MDFFNPGDPFIAFRYNDTYLIQQDYLKTEPIASWILIILSVVFFVTGVPGNVMIIGAVATYKKLRTKGNMLILNLAIADFMVSSYVNTFQIIGVVWSYKLFVEKPEICYATHMICQCACFASTGMLGVIALDRYLFICKNNFYQQKISYKTITYIILITWLLVIAEMGLTFTELSGVFFDPLMRLCTISRPLYRGKAFFVPIHTTLTVFLPLTIAFVSYGLIFIHVYRSKKKLEKLGSTTTNDTNMRLIKTLFIVLITFCICWTPYNALQLFDGNESAPIWLWYAIEPIGHSNSVMNTFIYGLTNARFREGYRHFLSCGKIKISK